MYGPTCRRLTLPLGSRTPSHIGRRAKHSITPWPRPSLSSRLDQVSCKVARSSPQRLQVRGKKTRSSMRLEDLPQGPIKLEQQPQHAEPEPEADEGPAYPTVVQQARRNMDKFENCVLLTRVGGFYELYFSQAEEYGPLLNLKVAQKRTSAGPVPMAGFPFFQLDRFLKTLVLDLSCYVAVADEFPNDPGDKVRANGLMHDRRVTRVITPGTLIDENFIDPYANNYVMAVHVEHAQDTAEESGSAELDPTSAIDPGRLAESQANATPIGLAWIDVSTGQFYTQSTTVTSLGSILSRVGPREVVVNEVLESQRDHELFSVLAEDKHLITFAPEGEPLPPTEWGGMLESDVPAAMACSFGADEVRAGSLLLRYVRERLRGLSMKLQPPQRYESMAVMSIDKSTMRALEIRQTMKDGAFRGSLLHAVRRTVTKGGARLLAAWLAAPSTNLDTIRARHDLVEYLIRQPDVRDDMVLLLKRSHDSQRLVQKFALGRGDADDLVALANTIRTTQDIVSLLESARGQDEAAKTTNPITTSSTDSTNTTTENPDPDPESSPPSTHADASCFTSLLARIQLSEPTKLADLIKNSIDEEGLVQQHRAEDSEVSELMTLAEDVVASEGTRGDAATMLPKSSTSASAIAKRKRQQQSAPSSPSSSSMRDYYSGASDENTPFVMKPDASPRLRSLHDELAALVQEKEELATALRERFGGAASLTLKWTPNLGHVCHVKGAKDLRKLNEAGAGVGAGGSVVGASRSTRSFHDPDWTRLGQRLRQARFEVAAEEQRLLGALRARVVANLVKLRRAAQVLDELDVAASGARLAAELDWTRPVLYDDAVTADATTTELTIRHVVLGGRHPTVEGGLREKGRSFTKNDCVLGDGSNKHIGRIRLITGPNMGGKSTYLRQNAVVAVLAQAGQYVPADYASLGVADAVLTRVGSADNLYADESTFMVEMLETARILRAATPRSLVVMDEVGRGTTPDAGTAVAFAALCHLAQTNRCRALFATHFHRLADLARARGLLADQGGPVDPYCTDVHEVAPAGFVYVHKLRRGVNRQSHALRVARLANVPEAAITIARQVLEEFSHDDQSMGTSLQNDTHMEQQEANV
ncbi:muts domain V-domain-containing protein [Hypoxylon sp. FL1284]|nr:muts domain V-domain-containing protein [Hypoxylon sp. FL1284]